MTEELSFTHTDTEAQRCLRMNRRLADTSNFIPMAQLRNAVKEGRKE